MYQSNSCTQLSVKTASARLKDAVFGICINVQDPVVATHREIAILRRCSEFLLDKPHRMVSIVSLQKNKRSDFIHKTLLHLGVSCGQIAVDNTLPITTNKQDIWLLVSNRKN